MRFFAAPVPDFLAWQQQRTSRPRELYNPITKIPAVSASALAGAEIVVERETGWLIDGDAKSGFRFIADANHDGDLTNDAAIPLTLDDDRWRVTAVIPTISTDGVGVSVFSIERSRANRVYVRPFSQRIGSMDAAKGPVRIGIAAEWGWYDSPFAKLLVDHDRNGTFDTRATSPETTFLRERVVEIDGEVFEIEVATDGSRISLSRTNEKPRVARVGRKVDARFTTFAGETYDVRELARSHYVVIYFWAHHCPMCDRDIAELQEITSKRSDVRVVVVAREDATSIRGQGEMSWLLVRYDGMLGTIFKTSELPSASVIAPGGKVVCVACSLGALIGTFAK